MDHEYNYDEQKNENTFNQTEEPVEDSVVENATVEDAAAENAENVNFVMQGSETEELEAESEIYSLKGSQVQQDSDLGADSASQATSENNTGAGYNYNYSYNYNNNTNYANNAKPEKPKKKPGKAKKWILCVAMAVVFGIFASVVFQASNRLIDGIFGEEEKADKTVSTTQVTTNKDSKVNSDVAAVAENVMPSVVSITNLSVQEVQNFFFGGTTTQQTESSGSGIIILCSMLPV